MKKFFKQNTALALAFTLPLALIVTITLAAYLPALFLSTEYNFVYSTCVERPVSYSHKCNDSDSRVFLHDTNTNESREITTAEMQSLNLSKLLTSPDGVTVVGQHNRGTSSLLFFDSGSSFEYYLTRGSSRKKLNLINLAGRYYYENSFTFIGWVVPSTN